ncbi:Hypothetical predicted protein [Octopus vulgaris]|uniref:Leucine-rich repeat-containing protein 74A-like n=1 Tax=Octopus vulgaris TaxID=6645 RepID=A0AA36BQN7_OCTVU|nr:Hypothetical predicted protein [Octopus vulgaris]
MEDSNTLNHKVDGQLRKSIDFDYIQLAKNCKGHLDLRSSKITLEELTILIPHIVGNIRINAFDLSQNHFSDEYGRIIARIIKNSDSIVEFCLKLNNLEGRGVQYIGQAIGAVALGEMLKHNKTLQTLDISSNRICWKGSLIMSKGLSKNRSLINLKMDLNPLTTTGAMDLLLAISSAGNAVEYFDIRSIQVINEFKLLLLAIQHRRNFTCVHGDIVSSHDFLGKRDPLKLDPMSKVIGYLKKNQIRPMELLRSFDKPLDWSMSSSSFVERLKMCDTELYKYEIRLVTKDIEHRKGSEESHGIDYRKLTNSIADHMEHLRQRRQTELRKERIEELYHQRILKEDVLIDDTHTSPRSILPMKAMDKLNLNHGKSTDITAIVQNNGYKRRKKKKYQIIGKGKF